MPCSQEGCNLPVSRVSCFIIGWFIYRTNLSIYHTQMRGPGWEKMANKTWFLILKWPYMNLMHTMLMPFWRMTFELWHPVWVDAGQSCCSLHLEWDWTKQKTLGCLGHQQGAPGRTTLHSTNISPVQHLPGVPKVIVLDTDCVHVQYTQLMLDTW